jgi:hypothetical protein
MESYDLTLGVVTLFIVIVFFLATLVVSVKCETYKTFSSLIITCCLLLDLGMRSGQLCRQIKRRDEPLYTTAWNQTYRDSIEYIIQIISVALFC